MKIFIKTLFFFLLVSQICFGQWTPVGLEDESIKDIAVRNALIFAVTSDSGKLYRSTDNGSNWLKIVIMGARDVATATSGKIFMLKDHLFSSSDNGETWDTLNVIEQLQSGDYLMNVSVSNTGIVYCGIWRRTGEKGGHTFIASSTDDGATWTTPGLDLMGGHLFDYKGEIVISAGYDASLDALRFGWNDVYLSTDNGYTWTDLGMAPFFVMYGQVLSLCLDGNILLAGSDPYSSGLFLSNDSCNTWTKVSTINPQTGLSIETGGTLIGTDSLGVFLFNDDGDSLGSRNDGLANLNIHTLTIDNNNYVYAGTDNGVWRRSLSDITSVEEEQFDEIPTEFSLSQNYPNPFNPATSIQYQVSSVSLMSLVVYDILGNEIETLISEEKPAGTYELTWNASNLTSGIYFYQLKAGEYISTKKMILLK